MTDNFSSMDRATLEEHARALASANHDLIAKLQNLMNRQEMVKQHRAFFEECCSECSEQEKHYGKHW